MEGTVKKWKDLSQEEQDQRITKIREAIKFYDLDTVSIKETLYLHCRFTDGGEKTHQATLHIIGRESNSKREKVEKFDKILKEDILKDLNHNSLDIQIYCIPIGEPMIPIKNVKEIRTGEDISIDHKPGQVILIDFFFSRRGLFLNSQGEHKLEMLENYAEKWGDKVRIICINIADDTAEKVEAFVKHVDEKGWTKIEHYHSESHKFLKDYGSSGGPHVALVETNGQVAFIGDPNSVDLEKSIESLLSGGDIIKRAESGASTEAGDPANIKEQVLKFSTEVGEKIKTNEELKKCKLERGYVGADSDITHDIHTNKMTINWCLISITLIGPKAEIAAARAEIEKIIAESTLKKTWREVPTD